MTLENPGLEFIVVGASVAGLASAIALRLAGYDVLVLERASQLGSETPRGCARIPPNAYKILAEWGLEQDLQSKGVVNDGFGVYKYENKKTAPGRDLMGLNTWDPELLVEARGSFMFLAHNELIDVLHHCALSPAKPGAKLGNVRLRLGAEVVGIDCQSDAPSVTLASGEVLSADVIVGADGASGVVRAALMRAEGVGFDADEFIGTMVYSTMVSRELIEQDPELSSFYDYPQSTVSMGSKRGAVTDMAGNRDLHLFVFTPDGVEEGSWATSSSRKLSEVLGNCDPAIKGLAELGGPSVCFQLKTPYELRSWVSSSGKVLAIGEAAHPAPACGLHSYSLVLEDAVFLGKIFSHSDDKTRIPELLVAFDEHRRPRCEFIRKLDTNYNAVITTEDGPVQEGRDAMMRNNHTMGRNVFESGDAEALLEETRIVFSYDAADDADEWWVTWGRYHDWETRVDSD
ncbi:FAD-binding-3 domain-containing protein [Mycena kentingensis (nom. inval.)]|nr:FAD-binding-3 domain-containing protein [Mycena kentingensis (nom. inval.)]